MMRAVPVLTLIALTVLAGCGDAMMGRTPRKGDWSTDFDAALAKAKAGDKLLLLVFSSDNPFSKMLDSDIFKTQAWADYAAGNPWQLVDLRVVEGEDGYERNSKLYEKYRGLEGIPALIVVGPDGTRLGKADYGVKDEPKVLIRQLEAHVGRYQGLKRKAAEKAAKEKAAKQPK